MKKVISIILALIALTACFGLVGCNATGKYKFSTLTNEDGNTFKVGEKFNFITLDEDYYVITFNEDGTCIMNAMGIPIVGTYKNKLFKVEMYFGDEDIDARIVFNTIIIQENDIRIVLKKAKD